MKKIYSAFVFSVLAFFAGYYFGADAAAMLEQHTGIALPDGDGTEIPVAAIASIGGVADGAVSVETFRKFRSLDIALLEGDAACEPGGYTVTLMTTGAAPMRVNNPGPQHSDAVVYLLDRVASGDVVTLTDIIAVCENGYTGATPPVVLTIQ